jgi:hypothetical protein
MISHRFRSALYIAAMTAAAGVWSTSNANADARFELRATRVNGAALSGGQTAHAIPNALVGDVISFDMFLTVRGTDANFLNDGIVSGIGSVRSSVISPQNLRGNLVVDVVRTQLDPDTGEPVGPLGFDAIGFSVGTQQDLDGDGDIDVGSNIDSQAQNFWAFRYLGAPSPAPAGLPNGARVGFGTFTVTSGELGSQTLVQFIGRNFFSGVTYVQDGVGFQHASADSLVGESILVTRGIPEPSTLAIGGAALSITALRRRRRRDR